MSGKTVNRIVIIQVTRYTADIYARATENVALAYFLFVAYHLTTKIVPPHSTTKIVSTHLTTEKVSTCSADVSVGKTCP